MADKSPHSESGVNVQTNAVGICPTCKHPLTQLGPDGECLRCVLSWAFAPEQDVSISLRYGHFEVELDDDGNPVALGAGAMAVTYRARDTVLNSVVALKVIGRKLADNPMARARFLREARAAAQINHPNVARVIHFGEQDGECFYAMELVEGETLEARVRRTGPLPVSQALEVIAQAGRALAAAETCGVVHRDIKPSNVMIESDASGALLVKIIDYGVAKVLAAQTDPNEQTQIGFIGTPAFASPEQFGEPGNAAVDARSDIYSLGVTLWYLLTGRTPVSGKTPEEILSESRQIADRRAESRARSDGNHRIAEADAGAGPGETTTIRDRSARGGPSRLSPFRAASDGAAKASHHGSGGCRSDRRAHICCSLLLSARAILGAGGTLDCRVAIQEPERRPREPVFRRGRAGPNPDRPCADRRSQSGQPHQRHAV